MALRQTTGFVGSLVRLTGLDWAVPDFSTLSRRQKTLTVDIPYRGSGGPFHLLIDSTGINVEGEGEWNARRHGGTKRRVWRKIHIGIDEKHWNSGRPSSPPATSAMRQCCPSCSTRSQLSRRSPASPPTAPSTQANAMMPSPGEVVGRHEVREVRAQLVVAVVVETLDRRVLDRSVHALDLTFRLRVVRLRQPVLDPVGLADHVEAHWP